jgi:hypothetical protein
MIIIDVGQLFSKDPDYSPMWSKSVYNKHNTGWMTRVQFPVRAIMGYILFATASSSAVGHTKPAIQWVPCVLSSG